MIETGELKRYVLENVTQVGTQSAEYKKQDHDALVIKGKSLLHSDMSRV